LHGNNGKNRPVGDLITRNKSIRPRRKNKSEGAQTGDGGRKGISRKKIIRQKKKQNNG